MRPGDMIEWTYEVSGELVHKGETLWSNAEGCYAPIGSEIVHLLVSVDDATYSWLNEKGLFHAYVDDVCVGHSATMRWRVVPRVCKLTPHCDKVRP